MAQGATRLATETDSLQQIADTAVKLYGSVDAALDQLKNSGLSSGVVRRVQAILRDRAAAPDPFSSFPS